MRMHQAQFSTVRIPWKFVRAHGAPFWWLISRHSLFFPSPPVGPTTINHDGTMRICIDADACPRMIKDFVYKVSLRLNIPVVLVANSGIHAPRSNLVSLVVVGREIDQADRHILDNCAGGDLVVTADIPLASSLVDKGVVAINPRGTVYTADNVKEALATRNLTQELREEGIMSGGPPPLGPRDKEKFANAIDRELTQLQRNSP